MATIRGPMKLVGDKSEKYTWAEVKKHVSLFVRSDRSNRHRRARECSLNRASILSMCL